MEIKTREMNVAVCKEWHTVQGTTPIISLKLSRHTLFCHLQADIVLRLGVYEDWRV
jgi:hypothetical protein